MSESTLLIDRDRFEFLLFAFFGNCNKPFPAVSKRAYRDLCRTLTLHNKDGSKCSALVDALLEKRIMELLISNIATKLEYDRWHYDTCIELIHIYNAEDITFTIGQAQKWINMTFKYLIIYGALDLSRIFSFLHIPIDSFIFAAVENQLHINRPCIAWSKITDYCVYLDYQHAIREALQNHTPPVVPLRWEFSNWLAEVEKQ